LTVDLILIGVRDIVVDYPCAKVGEFSFSRFGFIVRTDRQTESYTDADERYTLATPVGVSDDDDDDD